MSNFIITAKHDMFLSLGKEIKKGDSFDVFVSKPFVNKATLFNSPEVRSSVIRQMSNKDIDLVACRKEYFLNNGHFQVEERKNVLVNNH